MNTQHDPGYRDDLAYIHHVGFTSFATLAAPWIIETLRQRGSKSGRVIELGCGSGVLAEGLAAAGFNVTGYDLSVAMIDMARARVPQACFHVGSFLDVKLSPCAAVIAQGEVLNYLFDRRNKKSPLPRLFRQVYAALQPGGLFLFDIAEPGRAGKSGISRGYGEGPDWACLFTAEEDRQGQLLTRTITSFRRLGDHYRRDEEIHRLRLLPRRRVLEQLRAAGFTARAVRQYGAWRFPKGWVGVLARKPG
ncbi:MAG: class I SAM-dependent methyltransferase [Pirellulales bacterium]